MTRLFIDKQEVALTSDFQLDFYSQNPFFTKNGDYTYDLDIDLNHPGNRKIYQSINRFDVTGHPTNRSALLLSGPNVIVDGTEVILSIEDNIAKIQLVSGNSELNYLYAGETTIRQLNLGSLNLNAEYNNLNKLYPDVTHVCCPVISQKGNYKIDDSSQKTDKIFNELEWDTRNGFIYKTDTTMVPQPFLLYCIDKIIEAMGYSIEENVLKDDELAKRLIVIHGIQSSTDINRILPNWKVDEFITEVEKLFNVIFLVNQFTRKIKIARMKSFYQNSKMIEISNDDLVEDVQKNYDQEESLYITYDNIKYSLPSSRWYNYQNLTDELREKCGKTTASLKDILSYGFINYPYQLWFEENFQIWMIYSACPSGGNSYACWEIVDQLKNVSDETSENECELKIVPAEIYGNNVWITGMDFGGSKYYDGWITSACPVISNTNEGEVTEYAYQEIENGSTEESVDDSYLFIAIYLGLKPYMYSSDYMNEEVEQPVLDSMLIPHAVAYPCFIHYNRASQGTKIAKLTDDNLSLAIDSSQGGLYDRYYQDSIKVDTKTEYVFKFKYKKLYDCKSIYLIGNKKYYCKELHYTVTPDGIEPIVEGTFYLVN
jgi:hypothetical protein